MHGDTTGSGLSTIRRRPPRIRAGAAPQAARPSSITLKLRPVTVLPKCLAGADKGARCHEQGAGDKCGWRGQAALSVPSACTGDLAGGDGADRRA
jgi:hypothetical protein